MKKLILIVQLSITIIPFCFSQETPESAINCENEIDINGNFSTISGSCNPSAECSGQTCATGWFVAHGSPDIKGSGSGGVGVNGNLNNYALMWANNGTSEAEGIYFNQTFEAGYQYQIKVRSAGSLTASSQRGYQIYLTTGLSGQSNSDCNELPFPSTYQEVITQTNISYQTYTELTYTFIANAAYTQIYIRPLNYGGSQFDWSVDYIKLCKGCYTYNTVINSNNIDVFSFWPNIGYMRSNNINGVNISIGSTAGGANGNGLEVQNNFTATTEVVASQEINLLPDFAAVPYTINPSTQYDFNAKIQPCVIIAARYQNNSSIVQISKFSRQFVIKGSTKVDSLEKLYETTYNHLNKIDIFPNPAISKVWLQFRAQESGTFEIIIMNSIGFVVYRSQYSVTNKLGKQQLELNLSKFSSGVYIVKLKSKTGTTTLSKKIIKQ